MKKCSSFIVLTALIFAGVTNANTINYKATDNSFVPSSQIIKSSSYALNTPYLILAKMGPANPKGTFVFNPKNGTWTAYDANGNVVKSGKASGGKNYCKDIGRGCRTPVGYFTVYAKGSASCKSSKYPIGRPGAPMPYCMFFKGNYAIHGSYDVPNYNASHGCIRVTPSAARWLTTYFIKVGTRVIVRSY